MLPKRPSKHDAGTLIWEYLDGAISPSRAEVLSSMLRERSEARRRFVESAVMHGMLFEYFKNEHESRKEELAEEQADAATPRRRKRGRSSAA